MPKLLVKLPDKTVVLPLKKGENVIGRDDNCQLRLPNASVSRSHCRIVVGRQNTTLEDLDSQNGLLVNGKVVKQQVLKSGDELQVGSFSLVFLGDSSKDRFYRGRYVEYLAAYHPDQVGNLDDEAATRMLGVGSMLILQQGNHLIDHARIFSLEDTENFWHPMDKSLSFGAGGMIPVQGWFTWGVVAKVAWDGSRHVLERRVWWVTVTANNRSVSRQPLSHGMRFQIGSSRFRYDAPPLVRGA